MFLVRILCGGLIFASKAGSLHKEWGNMQVLEERVKLAKSIIQNVLAYFEPSSVSHNKVSIALTRGGCAVNVYSALINTIQQ